MEQLIDKYPFEHDLTTLSKEIELRLDMTNRKRFTRPRPRKNVFKKLSIQVFILVPSFFWFSGLLSLTTLYSLKRLMKYAGEWNYNSKLMH